MSKSYEKSLKDIEKLSDKLFHSLQFYRKEEKQKKDEIQR
jgi:hypothetical protein